MGSAVWIQLGILIFTLAIFYLTHSFAKQGLSKLRSKGRSSAQAHSHFVQGTQLLSRARSNHSKTTSFNLAKSAAGEADKALMLSPKDPSSHILKALALDLMGHRSSALRSLDSALSPPAVKALSEREKGDALFKRAEIQLAINRRRRVDSAIADLVKAVKLSLDNVEALCLLGSCYQTKGLRDEAKKVFLQALSLEPESVRAREGLKGLGP